MAKLLTGRLPIPPEQYNQQQFAQILRQLDQLLSKDIETLEDAEDKEVINFFLSN